MFGLENPDLDPAKYEIVDPQSAKVLRKLQEKSEAETDPTIRAKYREIMENMRRTLMELESPRPTEEDVEALIAESPSAMPTIPDVFDTDIKPLDIEEEQFGKGIRTKESR